MSHGLDTIILNNTDTDPVGQTWYWVYRCHCGRGYSIQVGGVDAWFGDAVVGPTGWYLPIQDPTIGFYQPITRCWESFQDYLYDFHNAVIYVDLISNRSRSHRRLI